MAQEGFQEVRAGLPSDAGAHLGAGTPSLGGIPPPLRPQLRQGSLQVALGLTGAIPLLNRPSLHRELPVQGWQGLNDVLNLILQHHWCFPYHQGYPVDLHKYLPKVTQLNEPSRYPRMSDSSSATAGPATTAPPFRGQQVEVVVPVEPCKVTPYSGPLIPFSGV